MCRQPAFSPSERERIYQGQVQGKSIPEIASELGRSGHVVRKWWRRIRQEGLAGLRDRRPGPAPRGILGRFDTRVRRAALRLKQTHPRWGPNRVLLALRQAPELDGVRLPHRSRV
ncbi:MAG TPA: hypothetical protein DEP84_07295, partial [Chloroflexi bacterium]|nr:hypothetical protein [Chloroflexota bacterium]